MSSNSSLQQGSQSLQVVGAIGTTDQAKLRNAQAGAVAIRQILGNAGAQLLGESVYQFTDDYGGQSGFTALFLLSESHVAIHTWPEHGCVEIDTYLCNYLRDNRKRCRQIFHEIAEYFTAEAVHVQHVHRRRLSPGPRK